MSTQFPCPAGTYQPNYGAFEFAQCLSCSTGHYCPQGSGQQYACPPGSYCPVISGQGTKDPQEYLGNEGVLLKGSKADSNDPATTFDGTWQPETCTRGFCPKGSFRLFLCPAGTSIDSRVSPLYSRYSDHCKVCDAGWVCPTAQDQYTSVGATYKRGSTRKRDGSSTTWADGNCQL